MAMTSNKYPVPSGGSLICTRFDCPDYDKGFCRYFDRDVRSFISVVCDRVRVGSFGCPRGFQS